MKELDYLLMIEQLKAHVLLWEIKKKKLCGSFPENEKICDEKIHTYNSSIQSLDQDVRLGFLVENHSINEQS